jgi:arabinofuranan 3-O-arabinosyltransferase
VTLQAAVVPAEQAGEAAHGPEAAGGEAPPVAVLRWFGLVWLTAFVILLANQPGRMVFDTKLPVDLDPAAFLASLWHLWDPLGSFGTLDNQAIGYAVPMAPVYLAGQLAHVPVWITERLWMSLIIAAGFTGLVKLAAALGIGSRSSRLLAGLVFALWPTFTIVIGSTSAAVLPGMLAPWAVLPLVKAVHAGGAGRSGPLWPAARSGAVVLLMGGVNATSTLDALLLPGLFIVTYARGRRLVSLSLAWAAAVTAATAWWLLPLLLQGRYAFNFLPYVEQSATTTGTASAAATLRGAGNWVAYLNFGTPWLPAGWAVVTVPLAILAAAAAAGCGLYGLSRRRMPAAAWLRLSAGIAAAIALAGYGGPLGGPFHGAVQHVLDGPLAPFRNVYKLEPVIAAALALGVAHATARWLAAAPADSQPDRKALAIASRLVLGLMLVGLAVPYLSGRILNPGSFTAVPRYWYQVASYLAAHSARNAALVVPADAHGEYTWGDPIDDPLEALGTSPWVAQGLVPYGGAGSQLVLQTAENAIESGEQVPGLGAYLQRAGIGYVVVRNDLDPLQVGYTPPAVVHQTLALSGFTRVATFGSAEIYAVADPGASAGGGAGTGQPPSPVSASPVSQTVLVNGGPDALLQLAGQHLLGPGQPAVLAGNPLAATPARWAVTDGLRRADEATGLINSNISYTYTATENNPADGQLGGAGGPPRQYLPVPAAGHQTVAVLSGAAQVTVSSYGSWLADTQQEDPVGAFDGNPATAWAEGSATTPVGQWIQITFDHPVDLPASVGIRLLDDNPAREIATRLRVSTAAGSATTSMAATGKTQPLSVAPGRTSWLRITIAGAGRVTPGGPGAGIADVLVPGIRVSRLLQPAEDPAGQRAAQVSFSFHQQVPSPVTYADPAGIAPMARTFTVAQPATVRLSASALAVPGAGLDARLDKLPPPGRGILQVSVATASSWAGPASLFRGRQPLIADNAAPVIHLSWHGQRRIRSLIVQTAGGSVPQAVEISSPDGTRQAGVGFGGLVTFKRPLTTDRIDVSFPRVQQATTVSSTGQVSTLPVELSRLSLPALAKLRVVAPSASTPFSLACGRGPELRIDGRAFPTAVSGTLGELTGFRPLQVRLCTPGGTLALGTGRHTLTVAAPGTFAVTDLSLTGAGSGGGTGTGGATGATASAAARTVTTRTVTTGSWQPDRRQVTIGPGPASYLEVHENYNAGWAAALSGHQLRPVYLDGWQQGFVVPAGAGGTITLSFRPAASYHLALVVSAAALALLLGLVAWSFVFGYGRAARYAGVPGGPAPARYAALGWLAVIALTFVTGGPVALAAVVVVALAWRWPRWLPALAFSGMAAAGVLTAAAAQPAGAGLLGAFGAPAQACALVALAAALVPARTRARPERPGAFGVVDELTCYFDTPAEPGNVHVEVWLPGHLDPERLREATTAMLAGQPRARARRAPGSGWNSGYTWEFPPQADLDPVSVASWQAEDELDAARTRFLAAAPPLDLSPPFRLLLARGPGRDALILNAHHAALDGHSCLRLLRLIADQYSHAGPGQVQHGQVQPDPAAGGGAGVAEVSQGEGQVRPPARRSVRIASQHEKAPREHGRGPRRAPGYGYQLLTWPGVPSVPPGPAAGEGETGPRATVNDVLVAALIETVRRWNRGRRQREHAGSCIKISVPLDARPPGGGDELGNLSRLGTVTAEAGTGDGRDLVAVVAGQTRQAKDEPGPQVDPALAALARARLPVAVKRRVLRAAIRGLGPLASDTSLLSNLGRVTDPPRFGPLSPERIWFSTSAHMPRGLSVGAITVDGRLQLCFRYRRALLDDAAAADFAATYTAALAHLAGSPVTKLPAAELPAKEECT